MANEPKPQQPPPKPPVDQAQIAGPKPADTIHVELGYSGPLEIRGVPKSGGSDQGAAE